MDSLDELIQTKWPDLEALAAQVNQTMSELRRTIGQIEFAFQASRPAVQRMVDLLQRIGNFQPSVSIRSFGVPAPRCPQYRSNPAPWSYQMARAAKPQAASVTRPRIVRKINP